MRKQSVTIMVAIAVGFIAGNILFPQWIGAGSQPKKPDGGKLVKKLDEIPPVWSRKLKTNMRFELVLDGAAVLDKETGLVWEQTPSPDFKAWHAAVETCYEKQVGNRMGWRLPAVEELTSLASTVQSDPSLPTAHPFQGIGIGKSYWTSTSYHWKPDRETGRAWSVGFGKAPYVTGDDKNWANALDGNKLHVWCVRGGRGHDSY